MSEKRKTILLVDDDEDYRYQQKVQLEGAGYCVAEADSAEAAEALLDSVTPDLSLVDLMMEEMDAGFTLCYHLKRRFPDAPVVLITAVTQETGLEFDAATGEEKSWIKADALLTKPVRFDQLKRQIEKLLQ